MITRREILAAINATTRETGYERALARVALTPWAFALAVHDTCGPTIKRHTVGTRAPLPLPGVPINGLKRPGGYPR